MGRNVGSIGIDVRPDTSTFNEKLLRDLKRAEKNKIRIPIDPETRARDGEPSLAQKVRNARDEAEGRIRSGNIKLRVPLGVSNDDVDEDEIRKRANRISRSLRMSGVKIELPVGFDNQQIAKDLRNAIKDAQRAVDQSLKIKVRVELDTAHVHEQWENLKEDFENDRVHLQADLDRQATVRTQLDTLARDRIVNLLVRINKRSLATAEATLASITGANILQRAGRSLENFVQNLDSVAFATANVATKMSLIGSSALASTSSVLALVGGLGQLGAYALTLPAFLAGLASAGVALGVAFKDFGSIMSDPDNFRQLAEDGGLPMAMFKAAEALGQARSKLAKSIREQVWSRLEGSFEHMTETLFPTFERGMGQVARTAGGMVRQILDAFTGNQAGFAILFDGIAQGLERASTGVGAMTRSFLKLATIGAGRLPDVGTWFTETMQTFERWIARSEANGNITLWLDNAKDAAHDLGRTFIALKGTLSGLVSAASESGGGTLDSFANSMEKVRTSIESPVFQDGLRNLFRGAHTAIQFVQDGFKDLWVVLLQISPVLTKILELSGESVGNVLRQVGEALKSKVLQTGAVEFFTGVRDGLKGMLDYLPNVADGLGNVGSVLGEVFAGIGPVVGQLFGGISDVFSDMAPVLKELASVFANFSANAVGGLVDALHILSIPLKTLLEAFNTLPGFVQTALLALLLLRRFTNTPLANPLARTNQGLNEVPGAANRARQALARPLGEGFLNPRAFTPFLQAIREVPDAVSAAVANTRRTLAGFGASGANGIAAPVGATARQLVDFYRQAFNEASPAVQRQYSQMLANTLKPGAMAFTGAVTDLQRGLQSALQRGLAPGSFSWRGPQDSFTQGLDSALRAAVPAAFSRSNVTQAIRDGYGKMLQQSLANPGLWNGSATAAIRQVAGDGVRNLFSGAFSAQADAIAQQARRDIARITATLQSEWARVGQASTALGNAALASGTQGTMNRFRSAIESGLSGARAAMHAGMAGVTAGFNAGGAALRSAASGLWNFLGGGWGVAFAAAFPVLAQLQENSRKVEQANRAVERSYIDMAKAALQAGEGVDGLAAAQAAQQRLLDLANTYSQTTTLGFGENVSVKDLLDRSGLGSQEFISLMQGRGTDAGKAYVDGLIVQLESAKAADRFGGPGGFFNQLINGGDRDAAIAALVGIRDNAQNSQKALEDFWKTDIGRSQGVAGALDKIANSGEGVQVTLKNISGIKADVFGNLIGEGDKVAQFATGFAQTMGGATEQVQLNFQRIQNSILSFQRAGSQGDVLDFITRDMVRAKAPIADITKALEGYGLTGEEAANKIKFVWGAVTDQSGAAVTVLGQAIPKLYEGSAGYAEFATALSAATDIDSTKLFRIFRADGIDLGKLGGQLASVGVSTDQMRTALKAVGLEGPAASQAMQQFVEAAGQMSAGGAINPAVAAEFAQALESIREKAGDAAGQASELVTALDNLRGEKLGTFKIATSFAEAAQAIKDMGKAAEGSESNLSILNQAFDDQTGNLDANVKGIQGVADQLSTFAETGMAKAIQAYENEMRVSGDSIAARQKVRESIAELAPTLDGMRAALEEANGAATITDEAWANLLKTFGLMPEQIEIGVTASTEGASGAVAALIAQLDSIPPGYTVKAGAEIEPAVAKLQELGFIVDKGPDGTYTVKTDADPETAKGQLQGLRDFIAQNPLVAQISVRGENAKQQILDQLGAVTISADLQAKIDNAVDTVNSLNGTPIYADANAILDKAYADIAQLNGTNVEAEAGAIITKALDDIRRLNGTPVTADAGANTSRGSFDIRNGLNGILVWAEAHARTGAARDQIKGLSGIQVWVDVAARGISGIASAIRGIFSANGNLIEPGRIPRLKAFANGGFENHTAQIARAGAMRIWAEPETGGEAYIPLAPGKRARSLKILGEVASRFGYALTKASKTAQRYAESYENGGLTNGGGSGNGASVVINNYNPVQEPDSVSTMRAGQRIAAMGIL